MAINTTKKTLFIGIILLFFITLAVFIYKKSISKPVSREDNVLSVKNNTPDLPPFEMEEIPSFHESEKVCDITNYGAEEGGKKINTKSISDAIFDCESSGGGKVIIPRGNWLTGPIHLKSNIDLFLEKDARLIFSSNPDDYLPVVFTRFEGIELYNYSSPIYVENAENVSISGEGTIDGQGEEWSHWNDLQEKAVIKLYKMADQGIPVEERVFGKKSDALRPSFMQFINSRNLHVSGVTILDGPMWTVHFIYSENISVSNVKIKTSSHNTDGIVIDSSKNAIIENSEIESGDDAVAIKSGVDKDGWRVNRLSEKIIFRNSVVSKGHSGISIGSEMSGGVQNVFVSDCSFSNTETGARIKSMEGRGGFVQNIWFENIDMSNIKESMLLVDMSYSAFTIPSKTHAFPEIKYIYFKNITGKGGRDALNIAGTPEKQAENLSFENINVIARYGVIIDNGKNISINNIQLKTKKDPFFSIENSKNISISQLDCASDSTKICLLIKGENSDNIKLTKSGLNSIDSKIEFGNGANPNILTIEK
jgi:hypothetical protein